VTGYPNPADWLTGLLAAAYRQAGADRGFLLSRGEDGYAVEAARSEAPENEAASGLYAESVLRHAGRTKEPLILGDASRSYWSKDAYIEAKRPRSILCMPIAVPGERTSWLLYLENRRMPNVFTERDAKVLELIATRRIYVKLLEDEVAATEDARAAQGSAPSGLAEPLTEREIEVPRRSRKVSRTGTSRTGSASPKRRSRRTLPGLSASWA